MLRRIYPHLTENNRRTVLLLKELGELIEEIVVAGAAATGLLITDPANPVIRPTQDLDIIVEVIKRTDYYRFQKKLKSKGFHESMDVICRFVKDHFMLDVMPTDETILGFTNRWYGDAFHHADLVAMDELEFKLISAPYFLGTKLEAFFSRGGSDFRISHDIEDCILLIDGCPEIVEEVQNADIAIREYLSDKFNAFLQSEEFLESISGYLFTDPASQARAGIIISRMKAIVKAGEWDS